MPCVTVIIIFLTCMYVYAWNFYDVKCLEHYLYCISAIEINFIIIIMVPKRIYYYFLRVSWKK